MEGGQQRILHSDTILRVLYNVRQNAIQNVKAPILDHHVASMCVCTFRLTVGGVVSGSVLSRPLYYGSGDILERSVTGVSSRLSLKNYAQGSVAIP